MYRLEAILLLSCTIKPVSSAPQQILPPSLFARSPRLHPLPHPPHPPPPPREIDPFGNFFIPQCALGCYLDALPNDGCVLEIDLRCHCSSGNILGISESCVEASCSQEDQSNATQKVIKACMAVGVSPWVPPTHMSSTSSSSSSLSSSAIPSSATPTPTAETTPAPSMVSDSSSDTSILPSIISSGMSAPQASPPGKTSSALTSPIETATTTPAPTNTLLTPPVADNSLSGGAKAGISISVLFVAAAIFVALSIYIRRLKRQLAHAKAAANVPDSVLRSPSRRNTLPDAFLPSNRRQSWPILPRGRRHSRRDMLAVSESPVSPLSPVFFRDSSSRRRSSIAGMLSKPRGQVLSIVVEREDEDASSLMSRRRVVQPVPGQSEGLVDPLELDAGLTGQIYEAPTSITPRPRSTEPNEDAWKEYDFGRAWKYN